MTELKKTAKESGSPAAGAINKMSSKGLDVIIFGAILLIFFLAPLFFTGLAGQGIGFEKLIMFYFLVLIGVVAWVTKGVILGELNLKRTPLDVPLLFTLAVFAVSTFLSVSTKDSLIGNYGSSAKGLVALVVFVLFYYLFVNNITEKKIKGVFWALIASSSILIAYSVLQLNNIFLLPMEFTRQQSFNPLGSLSGLTAFLVIVLPLFVVAATKTKEVLGVKSGIISVFVKIITLIMTAGLLVCLALLNGFTFWIAAIVSMVIVLMFFLSKIIKVSSNNLIIPLGVFLCLIVLLVLGNFDIASLKLPAEVSLSRSASWDITKSSLRENPLFGSGPSTFYYNFSKFKSIDFNSSPLWNIRFDSASGSGFEILSTVGALGAISVIVIALISLSISFLTLIKVKNDSSNSVLLALFASLISSIIFGVLFALNNSLILLTTIISIFAVSSGMILYPEKFRDLKLSFRSSAKYALALAAIFLCVSAGVVVLFTMGLKMYMSDMNAREAVEISGIDGKINKLNKAVALAPYQDAYYLTLANHYMALANQGALSGKNQAEIGEDLSKAIESGKKAVEISGNKAANNEALALIYENASFFTRGALEWSEQLYNKVIELDPKNPTPYLRIALVNMARSNAEQDQEEKKYFINEAIKYYDQAIAKKGDLAAAYYGKAIAYEKLNNNSDAIEQLRQANLISRDNLDYRFELGRLYFNRGVQQNSLAQTASEQIAVDDITPGDASSTPQISVQPTKPAGSTVAKNADLIAAEQLFLSILLANPQHANARYSLAMLYKQVGDLNNAKIMAQSLLELVPDEKTKNAVKTQFADVLD